MGTFLSDPFIQSILKQIDSSDVLGVALVGSYARDEADPFSDVDFDIFVQDLPVDRSQRYSLRYQDEKLVSLKYLRLSDEWAALTNPRRAIWAVPGLRNMQILSDPEEALIALQQAALQFDWAPLQSEADRFAVACVTGAAEEAHKILTGLGQNAESKILYAVWGLVKTLLEAVAVQQGLLIESENRYFDLIQNAIGHTSSWTQAFRQAWGLEPDHANAMARGVAALQLYRLTAERFTTLISGEDRVVVDRTLTLIQENIPS